MCCFAPITTLYSNAGGVRVRASYLADEDSPYPNRRQRLIGHVAIVRSGGEADSHSRSLLCFGQNTEVPRLGKDEMASCKKREGTSLASGSGSSKQGR